MSLPLAAAALAALVSPSPSPSASPAPIPEIARVVTADRGLESASRTARTTYVVNAAEIARHGYRTVAESLAAVPGVNVVRYGAFGTLANVGIRGSSSSQVLVLLDGLPLAGSQTESLDLNQIPTTGIERIEIVEGGGSTLYGSGSIGGVINIVSAHKPDVSGVAAAGSFDQQTFAFTTPYVQFSRTYAANGYPLPGGTSRTNDDAGQTSGAVTFERELGAIDLHFLAGLTQEHLGVGGPIDYQSPTSRQNTVSQDERLSFERRGARSTTTLALGNSALNEAYACDTPADGACPNAFDLPSPSATAPPYAQLIQDQRLMLDLTNATGGENGRLVYGVDLARGNARIDGGTGSACPPPAAYYGKCATAAYESAITANAYSQTAAFVQSQWFTRAGGQFYAGLRGERDLNSQATAQGGAISPSIGGIVPLGAGWQFKFNAATAFRAPTALELFYPPQGVYSNDALVPEHTQVGDAGVVRNGRNGQIALTWFTTWGSNLIVDENPAAFNYKPVNIGHAAIQGLTFVLASAPWNHLASTLNVTNLYRAQDLDTGERIVGRGPVFTATLDLRYVTDPRSRFDGAGLTVANGGIAEPVPAGTTLPPWAQAQAFTTVGAYAGWRVMPRAILTVRGYNLLDDRYAVYNGYPMPGTGFGVELRSK